jgi:8-oxo-dGTP diphosphatase
MRTPILAVDCIILFEGGIVLIRRRNPPFQGCYALPGGFVEVGESVEDAAIREAREETGLNITILRLIGVYSDPHRDPRGHVVSICHLSRGTGILSHGSDARSAEVFRLDRLPSLAFDHGQMIADAAKFCPVKNSQD